MFDVWCRIAETGSGNKWPLVAFKSARLEQLGDMLTYCKGFILWHRFFVPLTLAVFDVWGRLAETGSGNKSQLVVFVSTRLEQRRGMLIFDKIMKFVVYYTANFPH